MVFVLLCELALRTTYSLFYHSYLAVHKLCYGQTQSPEALLIKELIDNQKQLSNKIEHLEKQLALPSST